MFNIKKFLNLTYYTSELDEFLSEYSRKHPKLSASQREEMEKHHRIAKGLRHGNDMEGRAKE
jgi:hypothetical protein